MRVRLLPVLYLATIALTTSGCWMLFGMPNGGPRTTPVLVTAAPSQAGHNGICWRGEYRFATMAGEPMTEESRSEVANIEENRLNSMGVPGTTQTATPNGFVVVVPSSVDKEQIRQLVGATGKLDFVAVPATFATQIVEGTPLPAGMDATPMFSGDQISAARPGTHSAGRPAVDVELKSDGARIFDDFASKNFNGMNGGVKFAIVLDGVVLSALGLNTDHFAGSAEIVGNFSAEQVNNLVTVLKFGALPIAVQEVGFTRVSCATGA